MMMLEIVVCVCLWLGLGGWAFYHMNDGEDVGELFVACLLFAPFAAGGTLAKVLDKPRADTRKT